MLALIIFALCIQFPAFHFSATIPKYCSTHEFVELHLLLILFKYTSYSPAVYTKCVSFK